MTEDTLRQKLAQMEETVRLLQAELAETNRGLIALTLELEQRVDARTAELQKVNAELEARVRERTAALQLANDNLQNFTHTAAHDLRAPLRALRSLATIAVDDYGPKLGEEGQAMMRRIDGAATQMQRLLDDLLEYSKIAQREMHLQPVSLKAAVTEALDLLNSEIRAKNAAVTVSGTLPDVIAHSSTLVLIINNFIANALKFMPRDRSPHIEIRAERLDEENPPAGAERKTGSAAKNKPARFVRLSIQDNGIGIAREDLEKLFRVFQRLHSSSEYPGTGLGLALVKKGIERMGGRVGADSVVGQGSTFWIELPAASV